MPVNVLIVEDDSSVARFLEQAMSEAGYVPTVAYDGPSGLKLGLDRDFDLILLDVMLPGLDGLEVSRRLRASGRTEPILILTAKDTLDDKIAGLDSGADDYIVKPFHVAELLARARALLRRVGPAPVLTISDLTLDPTTRQAHRGRREIALSSTEYALLEFLMRNPGRVMSRAAILDHVWHYDFGGQDNVLDVYISYLRRKVDRGYPERLIHTVRGTGYRLGPPMDPLESGDEAPATGDVAAPDSLAVASTAGIPAREAAGASAGKDTARGGGDAAT